MKQQTRAFDYCISYWLEMLDRMQCLAINKRKTQKKPQSDGEYQKNGGFDGNPRVKQTKAAV